MYQPAEALGKLMLCLRKLLPEGPATIKALCKFRGVSGILKLLAFQIALGGQQESWRASPRRQVAILEKELRSSRPSVPSVTLLRRVAAISR